MEKVMDFLKRHSMASSSNSKLNGEEQKNTVIGMGGNGLTNNNNSNSNITFTYGNVQITENNYCGDTRRIDLDVCKYTRGATIIPTSKFFGDTTARKNMEEIWGLIIGDVKKIGVCGMGGIGKTTVMKHIHNRILEGENNKFDYVIWVTVSKESSVFKLQHDISSKLGLNLSADEDPITRAGALFEELTTRGRYLLILDDLWEGYPLEDVGIPDPDDLSSSNLGKLVLTTRSLDVCRSMKCKAFKIDLLSKDEAWSLFLHHVGHEVLHVKDLEPIARGVALECACLPLAIAIIGRSMTGKKETCEWRYALAKLKGFSKESGDEMKRVIDRLKFSFDRLEDKKFQKCLKYCALYPEDYQIKRDELVELLTLEGIIEEKKSRMDEIDECNAILNKLRYQIDNLHSQYLAISGTETKKLSHEKWSENLVKIHISKFYSLNASPMCPKLSTFILHNSFLQNIADSFFKYFDVLRVLKISSCNYLKVLPDSISNLVNLVGLFLTRCKSLRYVSPLAKLKNLQSLEISYTSLRHIPEGLEKLSKLSYLNLFPSPIKVLPTKIIPRLSNLRYLLCKFFIELSASELLVTKNLEMFQGSFRDIHNLRVFVKHREQEGSLHMNYKIRIRVNEDFELGYNWSSFGKVVKLVDCTLRIPSGEDDLYPLPKDVQELIMEGIDDLTNLCAIESLNYATDLRSCQIGSCKGVRELVTTSSSSSFALESLQTLQLYNLENLEALIGGKKTPCNVFPCLRELEIRNCPRIKVLFNVGLLSNLKNLEILRVVRCLELEEIIGGESLDNDKDVNEAMTCVTCNDPDIRPGSPRDIIQDISNT